MTADIFIDTNILLYAQSRHPAEAKKQARAREVMKEGRIGLSAQVLGEFYVNATLKLTPALSHAEATQLIQKLSVLPVLAIDNGLVAGALDWKQRYQVSYWDALILRAADQMGCHTLMSEDLAPGQMYGGVRVVNPF